MGKVKKLRKNRLFQKIELVILGNVLYAMGVTLALSPLHFYSGGFTGIAQLLRLFIVQVLHVPQIAGLDYLGILYFVINVPFFIIAYRVMGRRFCLETLISIVMASVLLAIIPIPHKPIITDPLLGAIVGGLGSGIGAGMVLRAGSSQGGQDLIGVCLAKTHPDFKVGNIGIIISVCIYGICLFIYDVPTVLYSIIFAVVNGLCIDRVHIQNIKIEAMIFTKKEGMSAAIMNDLRRGLTNWEGAGAYTNEDTHILVTVITKYEEPILKEIVMKYDEHAFVILTDHARVIGNFDKRFTE